MATSHTPSGDIPFNPRVIGLAVLAGLLALGLLALTIVNQFRMVQLRDARDIGSAYIQGFLSPYAVEAQQRGQLSVLSRTALMQLVGDLASAQRFVAIRIRDPSGGVIFASDSLAEVMAESPEAFQIATLGMAVAELHWPETAEGGPSFPEIEIYAPIYDPATNEMIAVGEIYQDARLMLADRRRFEQRVWGAVGLATAGFLVMMYLIARQGRQLIRYLADQRDIATQNAMLRTAAETAWRQSSQSNEALLNQLGAELHDGPVQMLSLLALTAGKGASDDPMAPQNIAQAVLADLRRISAGLTLPELGQLSVRETLLLATERHERATGTSVSVMFDHLPDRVDDQRKTCIYRIVQEGLNNAQRHGGGRGQRVSAGLVDGQLTLSVSDDGPARDTTPAQIPRGNHAGLGLDGLRNRLKVFGGALTTEVTATGGFVLRTTLPMA